MKTGQPLFGNECWNGDAELLSCEERLETLGANQEIEKYKNTELNDFS